MSGDPESFDTLQVLAEHAARLNALRTPTASARVGYDRMSGAVCWSDETDDETPIEVIWALRFLRAYRTGLMLNKPREEFKAIWDHALSLFPDWVGFRPERRQPTPELLQIYRRGDLSLRKWLRDLERRMGVPAKGEDGGTTP
jgi:hypothetical protein